jgi:hypothetical protein
MKEPTMSVRKRELAAFKRRLRFAFAIFRCLETLKC